LCCRRVKKRSSGRLRPAPARGRLASLLLLREREIEKRGTSQRNSSRGAEIEDPGERVSPSPVMDVVRPLRYARNKEENDAVIVVEGKTEKVKGRPHAH